MHVVHKSAYQKNAAARSLQDILGGRWVGHSVRVKAFALVFDFNLDSMFQTVEDYFDGLSFVFLVSVDDGVGDCFAHRRFNSKNRLLTDPTALSEICRRGSSTCDRLNVAGQNESRRLFGHKRGGLSRRELRLAAAINAVTEDGRVTRWPPACQETC